MKRETLFGQVAVGKTPEQFAGFGIIGACPCFFVLKMPDVFVLPVDGYGHLPSLMARTPRQPLVPRLSVSFYPVAGVISGRAAYTQIGAGTIKPVVIPMVNFDSRVSYSENKPVQQNVFVPAVLSRTATGIGSVTALGITPLARVHYPLVVAIVHKDGVSLPGTAVDSNFTHNPTILPQFTTLSRSAYATHHSTKT